MELERTHVEKAARSAPHKPLHPRLFLTRTRIATQPVQAATNVLVSSGANMVAICWAEASFAHDIGEESRFELPRADFGHFSP